MQAFQNMTQNSYKDRAQRHVRCARIFPKYGRRKNSTRRQDCARKFEKFQQSAVSSSLTENLQIFSESIRKLSDTQSGPAKCGAVSYLIIFFTACVRDNTPGWRPQSRLPPEHCRPRTVHFPGPLRRFHRRHLPAAQRRASLRPDTAGCKRRRPGG